MRNLKRVLSLALAVVMVIGMMVMTTSAAKYGDEAAIEYVEAVEVMSALGVFEGDDLGNFNPKGILTREQAAKIIAYMLLGEDNAEKLNANNTVFKDVAAGRWSAGYISYCTTVGILAGVGEGNFDPAGELTGVAFGKMLLVALGYDPKIEGYVGADWATNIATDIIGAGIDVKGVTLSEPLTREQACQMALQTLEASMVDYASRGFEVTLSNGQTVIAGASKAEAVTPLVPPADYYLNDTDTNATLQFCEKYFDAGQPGQLSKDADAEDTYGRPGYQWNKGKPIILVLDAPVATYTGKVVKADTIAADLSGYSIMIGGQKTKINNLKDETGISSIVTKNTITGQAGDDVTYSTTTPAEAIAAETGNGKVVEIYANRARMINKIVEIEYTVAKVTNIVESKDKTVYTFGTIASGIDYVNDNVDDTIELHGEIYKGGYVTLTSNSDDTVLQVYPTTTFTGTQTDFTTRLNTITVDGQSYKIGAGVSDGVDNVAIGDFGNNYKDAKYFVDQYGYVVATTGIAVNEYVYIVGADVSVKGNVDGNTVTAEVRAVLADGTTGVYKVPVEHKPGGDWVVKHTTIKLTDDAAIATNKNTAETAAETVLADKAYAYTLTDEGLLLEALTAFTSGTATANAVYSTDVDAILKGKTDYTNKLADRNTTFVVYDAQKKKVETFVGPDALPAYFDGTMDNAVAVVKAVDETDALISVVFIETASGVAAEAIDEYVFVDHLVKTEALANGKTSYIYNGVKANGEIIKVSSQLELAASGVYAYDATGKITDTLNAETGLALVVDATAAGMTVVGDLVKVSGNYYQLTEDTIVVYVDDSLIGNYNGEGGWIVRKVVNSAASNVVETIFVTVDK